MSGCLPPGAARFVEELQNVLRSRPRLTLHRLFSCAAQGDGWITAAELMGVSSDKLGHTLTVRQAFGIIRALSAVGGKQRRAGSQKTLSMVKLAQAVYPDAAETLDEIISTGLKPRKEDATLLSASCGASEALRQMQRQLQQRVRIREARMSSPVTKALAQRSSPSRPKPNPRSPVPSNSESAPPGLPLSPHDIAAPSRLQAHQHPRQHRQRRHYAIGEHLKALEPPAPAVLPNDQHQLEEDITKPSSPSEVDGGEEENQRGQQQRPQQQHAQVHQESVTATISAHAPGEKVSRRGNTHAFAKPGKSNRQILKKGRDSAASNFNIFLTERVVQSFAGSSCDNHAKVGRGGGGRGGARRRLVLSKQAAWHELMSAIAETLQLPAGARNIRALHSIQQARKLPLRPSPSMGGLDCRASAVVRPSECLVVETGPAYVLKRDGVRVTQGTAATQKKDTSDTGRLRTDQNDTAAQRHMRRKKTGEKLQKQEQNYLYMSMKRTRRLKEAQQRQHQDRVCKKSKKMDSKREGRSPLRQSLQATASPDADVVARTLLTLKRLLGILSTRSSRAQLLSMVAHYDIGLDKHGQGAPCGLVPLGRFAAAVSVLARPLQHARKDDESKEECPAPVAKIELELDLIPRAVDALAKGAMRAEGASGASAVSYGAGGMPLLHYENVIAKLGTDGGQRLLLNAATANPPPIDGTDNVDSKRGKSGRNKLRQIARLQHAHEGETAIGGNMARYLSYILPESETKMNSSISKVSTSESNVDESTVLRNELATFESKTSTEHEAMSETTLHSAPASHEDPRRVPSGLAPSAAEAEAVIARIICERNLDDTTEPYAANIGENRTASIADFDASIDPPIAAARASSIAAAVALSAARECKVAVKTSVKVLKQARAEFEIKVARAAANAALVSQHAAQDALTAAAKAAAAAQSLEHLNDPIARLRAAAKRAALALSESRAVREAGQNLSAASDAVRRQSLSKRVAEIKCASSSGSDDDTNEKSCVSSAVIEAATAVLQRKSSDGRARQRQFHTSVCSTNAANAAAKVDADASTDTGALVLSMESTAKLKRKLAAEETQRRITERRKAREEETTAISLLAQQRHKQEQRWRRTSIHKQNKVLRSRSGIAQTQDDDNNWGGGGDGSLVHLLSEALGLGSGEPSDALATGDRALALEAGSDDLAQVAQGNGSSKYVLPEAKLIAADILRAEQTHEARKRERAATVSAATKNGLVSDKAAGAGNAMPIAKFKQEEPKCSSLNHSSATSPSQRQIIEAREEKSTAQSAETWDLLGSEWQAAAAGAGIQENKTFRNRSKLWVPEALTRRDPEQYSPNKENTTSKQAVESTTALQTKKSEVQQEAEHFEFQEAEALAVAPEEVSDLLRIVGDGSLRDKLFCKAGIQPSMTESVEPVLRLMIRDTRVALRIDAMKQWEAVEHLTLKELRGRDGPCIKLRVNGKGSRLGVAYRCAEAAYRASHAAKLKELKDHPLRVALPMSRAALTQLLKNLGLDTRGARRELIERFVHYEYAQRRLHRDSSVNAERLPQNITIDTWKLIENFDTNVRPSGRAEVEEHNDTGLRMCSKAPDEYCKASSTDGGDDTTDGDANDNVDASDDDEDETDDDNAEKYDSYDSEDENNSESEKSKAEVTSGDTRCSREDKADKNNSVSDEETNDSALICQRRQRLRKRRARMHAAVRKMRRRQRHTRRILKDQNSPQRLAERAQIADGSPSRLRWHSSVEHQQWAREEEASNAARRKVTQQRQELSAVVVKQHRLEKAEREHARAHASHARDLEREVDMQLQDE